MSKLPQSAGKKRLAILTGLVAVVAVAWLLLSGPGVDQIGEEIVSAEVIEVIQRDPPAASSTQRPTGGLVIAVVMLPDGGRARVFAPLSKVYVGAKIKVKVKLYSDGTRHVTGAGSGKEN